MDVKEVRASEYAMTGWILIFRASQDSLVASALPRRSLSAKESPGISVFPAKHEVLQLMMNAVQGELAIFVALIIDLVNM